MNDQPTPGEARAPARDDRVRAIADMGFTERQARFLVLVWQMASTSGSSS